MIENTDYILKQIKKPNKGGLDYTSEYFCKPKKENVVKLKKNIDKLFLYNGYAILYNNEIIINNNDLKEENKNKKTHDTASKFVGSGLSVLAVKNEIMKGNFIFNCCSCNEDMVYTEYNGKKSINFKIKHDLTIDYGRCTKCYNEYQRERRKSCNIKKLEHTIRTRIAQSFRCNKYIKKQETSKILGCSFEYLKKYLEKQFTKGMSWNNHGEWNIDHIIPLCSANNEEELIKLCYYKNLQPLWAADNIRKNGYYNEEDKMFYLESL